MPGRKSKLTREQIAEIRGRYNQGDITQEELARQYGVTSSTISIYIRFDSHSEHSLHVARMNGHNTPGEMAQDMAQRMGHASWTDYLNSRAIANGHKSRTAYEDHLAQDKGYRTRREMRRARGKVR